MSGVHVLKYPPVQNFARGVLFLEPIVLLVITWFFWFPAPPRDQWIGLLLLWLPIAGARWVIHRRIWTRTPLDGLFLIFVGLGVVNIIIANHTPNTPPYTRGILMLARPLLGMALFVYCAEYARTRRQLTGLIFVSVCFACILSLSAFTSTQWSIIKTDQLQAITTHLPDKPIDLIDVIDVFDIIPKAYATFNPNEIGGALAWICPFVAGLALFRWRERLPRVGVTLAFGVSFVSLFLGQSRFALIGVFIALGMLGVLLIPRGRWLYLALAVLGLVVVLELAMVFNIWSVTTDAPTTTGAPTAQGEISARDSSSFNKRLGLWRSGLDIIRAYPLTGVGMSAFRDGRVRVAYPVSGLKNPPHAHNEVIQIGTDLGLPGVVVYLGWHVVTGWMLVYSWRHGQPENRALVAAVGAGLIAHAVYGLGDAITLWDRFAFIYWWLLGLAAAQYTQIIRK